MSIVETDAVFESQAERARVSLAPRATLVAATIGAGLSAGLFYGYQVSVIRALAQVDDVTYVKTFQAINETIENGWFFVTFLGTIPLIVAALVLSRRSGRATTALIGAGLVLNLAFLAITSFGNIPLNDALARAAATPEAAASARAAFEVPWNQLNLARTLAQVGSFVVLTAAASRRPGR